MQPAIQQPAVSVQWLVPFFHESRQVIYQISYMAGLQAITNTTLDRKAAQQRQETSTQTTWQHSEDIVPI